MTTTQSEKRPGILELMKEAAKNMWRWFTAAPETIKPEYSFLNEKTEEKQLFVQHEIEGTPFKITGNKEKGYWLTMGPYRLTGAKKTKKGVLEDLENEKWHIIARIIHATNDFEKNIKPTLKEN